MGIKDNISGKAGFLEEKVEYALLYDFYGALLKEKNRSMFEDYMLNDMTLSEIAAERNITRQGVRDVVNRAKISLAEYEERLGLVKRFDRVREYAGTIRNELAAAAGCVEKLSGLRRGDEDIDDEEIDDEDIIKDINGYMKDIEKITEEILEEF